MPYRKINMPSKEELALILRNRTNDDAATFLSVSRNTIVRWLKAYDLNYYDLKYPELPKHPSNEQSALINASILGDATLDKHGRFKLKLKKASISYLNEVHEKLYPFTVNSVEIGKAKRKGKWNEFCVFYTPGFPFLKALRSKWYPYGKKLVPHDLKLTKDMIAHWYCQDGCNQYLRKSITFHTNSFLEKDVEFLQTLMADVVNMKPSICYCKKQPILSFGARQYYDFIDIIRPYVSAECFQYKVDTSKAPITKAGYGAKKLDFKKATKIRRLYATEKYTQKKLGVMFGVTGTNIGRIINNEIYKTDLRFGGSAEIHITKITN